jgi:hypothetical protein
MVRAAALTLVALAVAAASPSATAGSGPCQRAGWKEIARDRQGNLLAKRGFPGVTSACLFGRDKLLALTDPDDYVSHATLRGHFVAFFDHYIDGADPEFEFTQFKVVDVERRRRVFIDRTTAWSTGIGQDDANPPKALPVVVALKPNGSVAWSTCPWHYGNGYYSEPLRCNKPRAKTQYQVLAHAAGSADRRYARVLDAGPAVDPATLELHGSRLTWRSGERLRHARLP